MSEETIQLEVSHRDPTALPRIDRWLSEQFKDWTRSKLSRWIQEGRVTLDGNVVTKPSAALPTGSTVRITPPPALESTVEPQDIPINLLFQDDAIVVVDKPAGMIVHPGAGQRDGSLVNALLGKGIPLADAGGPQRPGIVHRLDQGTSGVIVVAKTNEAYLALQRKFADRSMHKRYLALVWGRPKEPSGLIEKRIGRSSSNPMKMAVTGIRGEAREASSEYNVLEEFPGFSWVEVYPKTGRTHQIRVHLQSLGHPIVGDELYGGPMWKGLQDPLKRKAAKNLEGLGLHAANLNFDHPIHQKRMKFHAKVPERLQTLIDLFRGEIP